MSYESVNYLSKAAKFSKVKEFIELLGYKKNNWVTASKKNCSYFWYEYDEYKSWSAIQLDISHKLEQIEVRTRSNASRSYWDNLHQNKTIKMLQKQFGGYFTTDAGRNRCDSYPGPPPHPTSSGCFLARWRFHYALSKVHHYLLSRDIKGPACEDVPAELGWLNASNPRIISNNLIVPYIIAVWEDYFRYTFEVLFETTKGYKGVLKEVKLNGLDLEPLIYERLRLSKIVSSRFSFQRPSIISKNYKLFKADIDIDIAGVMRKPYKRKKESLFDFIELLVENRNALVHEGALDTKLFDKEINSTLEKITEAVDRVYCEIGSKCGFEPIHTYW